ncbi:MAG: malto-oligosyltrehalose trehalohydrolase, partial [Chloroflexi bacterium]
MHRFAVWAPRARVIDLVSDGRRLGMRPADGGWWESGDAAADAGTRYGFSIEGGPPRPDPRSLSQPDGVLGLSEVVDQTAYPWRDAGWRGRPLAGLVLYELHIGTFTAAGTFDSAIERLPHL